MKRTIATLLFCLAQAPAFALQFGQIAVETDMKREALFATGSMGTVKEKVRVAITARNGGWLFVETDEGKDTRAGWVRLLDVKLNPEPRKGGLYGRLFGKPELSLDILKKAPANPERLEKLHQFAFSTEEAKKFAREAKLKEQKLDYLPPQAEEKIK